MINNQHNIRLLITFLLFLLFISGCESQPEISTVPIAINLDNQVINYDIEIGTTIQTVLSLNQIKLNPLDKVNPPVFSVITEPITVEITRVEETFESEEIVIPFEQQTVRNESLPERQTILIQPGVNGLREITYRLLFENEQLFSRTEVRRVDIISPKPEIMMVGIQTPFTSIPINGKIVYLSSGNAWLMENETSNRKPIITNGKLDGRILELSENGRWLLFTQISEEDEKINELWVIDLEKEEITPLYLKIDNIIHFANWVPGNTLSVMVSTVEPRDVAPGWQANNNLIRLTLGADGKLLRSQEIIESNSGGIYGWWGTNFQFSPDGKYLLFIRPDGLGLVDLKEEKLEFLSNITPYQTKSDWAWVSPISWSTDNHFVYWVDHKHDTSLENPELSPFFDLKAIDIKTNRTLNTIDNVGMFASPTAFFSQQKSGGFQIAFLQAIFPDNSDSSRYQLMLSDRDGSNLQRIFPIDDMQGLEPQKIFVSPCNQDINCQLGFIYQGNFWIINLYEQLSTFQITGDGLITQIEWN
ncbi:MAG: G5 domain-containing protein [Anaerolineaceae bacterium]|nr:G5 domain-containing protein [Anaerolineaceae bacterium]